MYRKAIIFLPDGMADDQLPELNGKTPLEYAHKPLCESRAVFAFIHRALLPSAAET